MSREAEFHAKIQALRSEFAEYIDAEKLGEFNTFGDKINSAFVDLLILNDAIHEKKRGV